MSDKLQLDVISDMVCPWCYIGKRKLDVALAQFGETAQFQININWRPYRLDPNAPAEGRDYKQAIEAKLGPGSVDSLAQRIGDAAEGTGIAFAFDRITRSPNTLNAHRLIRWAGLAGGDQHALVEELFSRYFERGEDIGAPEILLQAGETIGMDRAKLKELFESDADSATIRTEDAQARDAGVVGVPAFLAGQKFLLMGAQEPDYFLRFFNKAHQKLNAQST